jgi:hypothetical protein
MTEEVGHNGMGENGRGTAPSWAGATPLLHTFPWPKVNRGSLQPNNKILSVHVARIWEKQAKKVEVTYFSFDSAPSSAWDAHKSRENEEINETRMRKVTQKKTPDWEGATPL